MSDETKFYYSINNECIASSLNQTDEILSDFLVPSLKLTKGEIDGSNLKISNISSDIYKNVHSEYLPERGLSGKVEFLLEQGMNSMEYKGFLKQTTRSATNAFLSIFFSQKEFSEIIDPNQFFKKGFTYKVQGNQNTLTGVDSIPVTFYDNDFIVFNQDVVLSNIGSNSFEVIKDCTQKIVNISTDINIPSGEIISSLSQRNGVVTVQSRRIVSSDIDELSNFVDTKITNAIDNLDYEFGEDGKFVVSVKIENGVLSTIKTSKVDNSFIDENSIHQSKISGLVEDLKNISSDLSTVIIRNRGDVSVRGDLSVYKHPGTETDIEDLTHFLKHNINEDENTTLYKGFLYKNILRWNLTSEGEGSKTLDANEYLLVRDNVKIADAKFSSFNFIRDYDFDVSCLNDRIDSLSCETVSATTGLIIDSIKQEKGFVSATTRQLVSSDVGGLSDYVENEINKLNCDNHLEDGYVISSLHQSNGKIEYRIRKIVSSDVSYLSDFVDSKINSAIDKLSCDDVQAGNGEIISFISQKDGVVSASKRTLISSDVNYLSDYVTNEICLSVQNIQVEEQIDEVGKILTSLSQTDGKISVGTGKILSSYIEGLETFVDNKIETLSNEIVPQVKNISVDLYKLSGDFSETSSDFEGRITNNRSDINTLSTFSHDILDNTFVDSEVEGIKQKTLLVADVEHREIEYKMIFKDGTLVLEKHV